MRKSVFLILLALFQGISAFAQKVDIYEQIPPGQVKASASSSISSSPASQVVDGKGMTGEGHVANNLGEGMWVSEVSSGTVQSPATSKGAVWFLCELGDGEPVRVDQMRIWNHNQNEHTRRGLNKVFIEYSGDGRTWTLLKDGEKDYHIIPESVGRNPEPADYVIDMPGKKLRYICITAAGDGSGNHYDLDNPVVVREMNDMHQNPGYYGLAEIRFYVRKPVQLSSVDKVTDIAFEASQGYLKTEEGPSREFFVTFDAPLYAGAELSFRNGDRAWTASIAPSAEGVTRYDGLFPAGSDAGGHHGGGGPQCPGDRGSHPEPFHGGDGPGHAGPGSVGDPGKDPDHQPAGKPEGGEGKPRIYFRSTGPRPGNPQGQRGRVRQKLTERISGNRRNRCEQKGAVKYEKKQTGAGGYHRHGCRSGNGSGGMFRTVGDGEGRSGI